ncbi:MAG: TIGR00730 family Rossman fold protein [Myxococcota bacterium]|nr:TIGR00730 family Rossman fold protein [Myxococcota bacterium]
MSSYKRIAVYCGSSASVSQAWHKRAADVGQALAQRGICLVYGGGRVGLMGTVADAALDAGGQVIGVIPDKLQALEVGHTGLSELIVVDSMHSRKAMMMHLSDAFVALPGGFGTLEELAEVVSLGVLNYHFKPSGLLNWDGYYDHLVSFFDHAEASGFIRPGQRNALHVADDLDHLLASFSETKVSPVSAWLQKPS